MDMKKMMKQAQKMQAEMEKAQAEMATLTFESSAGGGAVKVVAQGDGSIVSVKIDAAAVDSEDIEMLEDMLLAATNDALSSVNEIVSSRMASITGGLNLPGF
jgi:DNA-binding YbaB/EbfC family protein